MPGDRYSGCGRRWFDLVGREQFLSYQFGCWDYYNPYSMDTSIVNYSEPVITIPVEVAAPVAGQPEPSLPAGVSAEGMAKFDQARAAFYAGKYDEALKLTNEAVAQMPHDAVLHEFVRSCCSP